MPTTTLASSASTTSTIAGVTICMALAYISVILRFLSRRVGRLTVGSDDYTIVLALVSFALTEAFRTANFVAGNDDCVVHPCAHWYIAIST